MILSLLIGSYFKFIMYGYVFAGNKQNRGWMHRPINVLTVTSAIIHHVTNVAVGINLVMSLMIDTPLGDILGLQYCQVIGTVAVYGLVYLTGGGLGISVYRVLYIRHELWVKYVVGEKLLLAVIWFLSITGSGLSTFLVVVEDSSHRSGLNMCTGLSVTQNQILREYNISIGSQMLTTRYLQITALAFGIATQTIELLLYIWFFCHRYQNDNGSIKVLLTKDVTRDRNTKNVITFLGQFYGFITEYAFLISLLLFTHFADEHTQYFRAFVGMAHMMNFGLLSAVDVLCSPGLRSFMK